MVSTRRLGIEVDARIEGRNGLAWASGSWGLGDMTEELLDNATSTTTNTALNTTFPTVSGRIFDDGPLWTRNLRFSLKTGQRV
jgi:hypothetical protein